MQDAHEFLRSLTVVLAVAAITTVVFQRLRQPVVLGYIIAGLIVGPHVPIPLVADPASSKRNAVYRSGSPSTATDSCGATKSRGQPSSRETV